MKRDEEEASSQPNDVGDVKLCGRVRNMIWDQQSIPEEAKTTLLPPSTGEQVAMEPLPFAIDKEPIIVDDGDTRTLQIPNVVQSLPMKKKKKAKAAN